MFTEKRKEEQQLQEALNSPPITSHLNAVWDPGHTNCLHGQGRVASLTKVSSVTKGHFPLITWDPVTFSVTSQRGSELYIIFCSFSLFIDFHIIPSCYVCNWLCFPYILVFSTCLPGKLQSQFLYVVIFFQDVFFFLHCVMCAHVSISRPKR